MKRCSIDLAREPGRLAKYLSCAMLFVLGATLSFSLRAQGIGIERAGALPIADAHFHLMLFMTPADLAQRIQKNNVKWVVSAGAIGDPKARRSPWTRDFEVHQLLGKRFVPAVGGSETYRAELEEGVRVLIEPQNKRREQVVSVMEDLLKNGHRAIVETFPNAETSSTDPLRRRRIPTNAPFFHDLMRLSTAYRMPVPMHMQWHPGSVQEL
eukprot:gene9121-11590_t